MDRRQFVVSLLPGPFLCGSTGSFARAGDSSKAERIETRTTPAGVQFSLLSSKPQRPAPTLFVFATSAAVSLGHELYVRIARLLLEDGVLPVSIDLPCHGHQRRHEEPEGLAGWRHRMERENRTISDFVGQAQHVLDFLIAEGYTNPEFVAACGTSRGGFAAAHFAAADPRIGQLVLFAPVTDLRTLKEFNSFPRPVLMESLALTRASEHLRTRATWICVGNNDQRVGTGHAIDFAKALWKSAADAGSPSEAELHVVVSEGHRVHDTAHDEAAVWLRRAMFHARASGRRAVRRGAVRAGSGGTWSGRT